MAVGVRNLRSTCEDPKFALVTKALQSGISVRLRAWGTSMLPSLWPGDVLTIQRADRASVAPGDIVLAVRNQQLFIHRLVKIVDLPGCSRLILRGDAMPENDPPAQASELLGRVCRIERKHRIVTPRRGVSPISRILGTILCYWGAFRNLALRVHSIRYG
jgi:Peptidase S24-like